MQKRFPGMKRMNFSLVAMFICLAAITFISSTSAAAKEEYTGTVIGTGGRLGGTARPFTLSIEAQTPPDETARAVAILAESKQDGLLKLLEGKKLGYFSMGSQLGRDLNFVQVTPTADGGRRYLILFERWLNTYEVRYGTRSQDYPFTYIELFVDSSGKGQGTMIPAARIRWDKGDNQIEVENFGIYPARLTGVKLRNKS
jgi:hypothetical protein